MKKILLFATVFMLLTASYSFIIKKDKEINIGKTIITKLVDLPKVGENVSTYVSQGRMTSITPEDLSPSAKQYMMANFGRICVFLYNPDDQGWCRSYNIFYICGTGVIVGILPN